MAQNVLSITQLTEYSAPAVTTRNSHVSAATPPTRGTKKPPVRTPSVPAVPQSLGTGIIAGTMKTAETTILAQVADLTAASSPSTEKKNVSPGKKTVPSAGNAAPSAAVMTKEDSATTPSVRKENPVVRSVPHVPASTRKTTGTKDASSAPHAGTRKTAADASTGKNAAAKAAAPSRSARNDATTTPSTKIAPSVLPASAGMKNAGNVSQAVMTRDAVRATMPSVPAAKGTTAGNTTASTVLPTTFSPSARNRKDRCTASAGARNSPR